MHEKCKNARRGCTYIKAEIIFEHEMFDYKKNEK